MKISCLMANYNTDINMLRQAIDSILSQTYTNFEFIIVDDASSDGSYAYLKERALEDKRIVLLRNDINRGLAYSLNRALEIADGEYIARMDSDDISFKNRFMEEVSYLDMHPNIDVIGSFAKMIGEANTLSITPFYNADDCKSQLLFSPCLIHPTVMMRTEFLKKNHLNYNESFLCSQDFELWARCSEYGNLAIVNKVLLFYRIHGCQVSNRKRELQKNYAQNVCEMQLKKLTDLNQCDLDAHLCICGYEDITTDNCEKVIEWIYRLLELNQMKHIYDNKSLYKISFNRVFNLVLKGNNSIKEKMLLIIKHKELRSIINFNSLFYRIIYEVLFRLNGKRVND